MGRLVFLDESGLRLGATNRYGWAPQGEKAYGREPHGAWETMTMIGAMSTSGLRGFMTIDAATSSDVFVAYVENELAPRLQPGDCVVMDNLAAHKNQQAKRLIEERGANVVFLPPYSPDFNPIEKLWAKLKELIRRCETLTRDTFDDAVAGALAHISISDMTAWTKHCGYSINAA